MKKISILFLLLIGAVSVAQAQLNQSGGPLFKFDSGAPDTGEEFCMEVTVEDFTDITAVKFPVEWDPAVVEFVRVDGLALPGLSQANFDASRADEGLLFFDWQFVDDCETATSGLTIADDTPVFTVCFRAISTYGASTEVNIINDTDKTNDPLPVYVQRFGVCSSNIFLRFLSPATISTSVRPIKLVASTEQGNTGELVTVDVKVAGFDQMTSMQFSMNWDTTVIRFEEVIPLENLPNLSISGFGTPNLPNVGPGNLTTSWSLVEGDGVSLDDSITIFQVNYRIVGDCDMYSPITFSSTPTNIEATNTVEEGFLIPVEGIQGGVSTTPCDPEGWQLFADCGGDTLAIGETICVKITGGQLDDISDFRFLMEWNPNILKYTGVQNFSGEIQGFNDTNGSFQTENTSNGILGVDWEAPGGGSNSLFFADIPDQEVLFEVCFEVVGFGGNSPFRFDPLNARVRIDDSDNTGIIPNNCEVAIERPEGVQVSFSQGQGRPDDVACVDVTVASFNQIDSIQFSVGWEPTHAEFVEITNINTSLITDGLSDFSLSGAASGNLVFDWENATPRTVTDGTRLFSVCYNVIGTPPGELGQETNCEVVGIVPFPIESEATNETSNGGNIGIVNTDGAICVLNPDGFFLVINQQDAFVGTDICIPFKVGEFDSITQAQFEIKWDPTLLSYVDITNLNQDLGLIPGVNVVDASANLGILVFDWQAADNTVGASLADSTVLFEVCYDVIGEVNECADIEIDSEPNPSVQTVNGVGSVIPVIGGVCIKDRLIIVDSLITPVTCPDANDGSVELTVVGGTGNIFYTWSSVPPQPGPRARNLPVGEIAVEIFDESSPPLVLRDTFMIPLTDNLPEVNAGPDVTLGCDPPFRLIDETTVSTGSEYAYRWTTIGGELPSETDNSTALVSQPGLYILSVRNTDTGCALTDTVEVFAAPAPIADAGEDLNFDCTVDFLTLDASGSTPAPSDTTVYEWTALDGGLLEPGDENAVMPRALFPGTYALEIRFNNTGCSATDTVIVRDVSTKPDANAGMDIEIGCSGDTVLLDGGGSDNLQDVFYTWMTMEGDTLETGQTYRATEVGSYVLEVRDIVTQCTAMDTVNVIPNDEFPVVDAGTDLSLTCTDPTVTINTIVTNSSTFEVLWTGENGGTLEEGTENSLMPVVLTAGDYIITVTDTVTNCIAMDTVSVSNTIDIPMVEAGEGGVITCAEPNFQLEGSGVIAPDSLKYTWLLDGNIIAEDSLSIEVSNAGTYTLQVENLTNGCVNQDEVTVTSEGDLPVITVNGSPAITCAVSEVTINTEVAPADANYTIQWTVEGNGNILTGANSLSPTVDQAGSYRLRVENQETGCVAENVVVVEADTLAPIADAGMDQTLTCATDIVTLDGIGSESGASIKYQWMAMGGGAAPENATLAQASTSIAGTYILQVTDTVTTCVSTDTVVVDEDRTPPTAVAADPDELSCLNGEITLDATLSDQGGNYAITWTPLEGQADPQSGANQFLATVAEGGQYQLDVRNLENGCVDSTLVTVVENTTPPMADAGTDIEISCPGTPSSLDGSASSTGNIYTYSWTVVSGNAVITNGTSLTPSVDQPGVFELEVTNTDNGCTATATVTAEKDPALADANAGEDIASCTSDAVLFADAAAAANGVWTSLDGAVLESDIAPSTFVDSLSGGANRFVWTLSTADCPNYDADTVTVTREIAPIANSDLTELTAGTTETSINVLSNDQANSAAGVMVTIMAQPTLGTLDSVINRGVITYRTSPGLFGEDEFTYQICNSDCPTLCDSAFVRVSVPFDENFEAPPSPNGITPNDDGLNDELAFELLDTNPERWPDNEIIIFNRWGDIVYEAKPYLNDWKGTTDGGQELPHGTYYYILRLDISEGIILKGDITIIK